MIEKAEIMDEKAMQRAITRISFEIVEKNKGITDLYIVGIKRRGVTLAKWIGRKISEVEGKDIMVGELDITRYRDDISDRSSRIYGESKIDFDVTDKKIVLVDDVLYTGRTVRAAIDALISLGRPKQIQLAVLVDRGHRELPIRPDYVGKNVPTSHEETVKVLVEDYDMQNRVIICTH